MEKTLNLTRNAANMIETLYGEIKKVEQKKKFVEAIEAESKTCSKTHQYLTSADIIRIYNSLN